MGCYFLKSLNYYNLTILHFIWHNDPEAKTILQAYDWKEKERISVILVALIVDYAELLTILAFLSLLQDTCNRVYKRDYMYFPNNKRRKINV